MEVQGSAPVKHLQAEITPRFANHPKLLKMQVDDVLASGPCKDYPKDVIQNLAKKYGLDAPYGVTVIAVIAALRGVIPDYDLLWLALRPGWYAHPDCVLRWLAADFAAFVLPNFEKSHPNDARPRAAIVVARKIALGLLVATSEEARASASACYAAASASWAASWSASASSSASWAAAASASWAASWSASASATASYSAYYAAYYASYAALDRLAEVVGK